MHPIAEVEEADTTQNQTSSDNRHIVELSPDQMIENRDIEIDEGEVEMEAEEEEEEEDAPEGEGEGELNTENEEDTYIEINDPNRLPAQQAPEQQEGTFEEPQVMFSPQVDKRSQMLAAKRQSGPAHERLHKMAIDQRLEEREAEKELKEKVKARKAKNPEAILYTPLNNGERLYHKARVIEQRKARQANKDKRLSEEKKMSKYTRKPVINRWSQKMKRSYKTPLEDNLIGIKYQIEHKREEEMVRNLSKEVEECTFNPEISQRSKTIGENTIRVEGQDGMGNIHNVLYMNSQVRTKEREMILKDHEKTQKKEMFKPKLVSKQMGGKRTLEDI